MTETAGRTIRATDTSLRIVEWIQDADGASLRELEEGLDLARSTVHAHLQTLMQHNFVVKEGNRYHLGLKLFNLGEHAKRDERYGFVERMVRQLADRTGEEVDFSVPDDGRTIVLFDEVGSGAQQGFQTGDYFYMNTNAAGKAILAEYSRDQVEAVLDRWGLPAETDETITDRDRLFEELEETRERGYAINNQENFEGIRAIGAVIHNPDGSIFGAPAISGPVYRLQQSELEELAELLLDSIEEMESEFVSGSYSE